MGQYSLLIAMFLSETIQYNLNYLNIMNYRVVIICNVIHEKADGTILTSYSHVSIRNNTV